MSNLNENEPGYIPGVCNIGKEEIKNRRNAALVSGILSIIIGVVLVVLHTNKLWSLVLFLPLVSAAVGLQQWYFKFCVRFGMQGFFNFKNMGNTDTVEQAEMRKLDKAKARKMIITGIIIALIITIGFYFLI